MNRIPGGALLTILVLASAAVAPAQEPVTSLLRSDLEADRVAIVTVAMVLTDSQAQVFWPIYRDYQNEAGDRSLLVRRYLERYREMGDSQAKNLADEWFKLEDDRAKLLKKYYRRMERALSSSVATRFVQVEHHLALFADLQAAAERPLIHAPASP